MALNPEGGLLDAVGLIPNANDAVVSQLEDMVKQSVSLPFAIVFVTVPAEGAFVS